MNLKKTFSSIAVGAGAVALGLGIQYAAAAWTSAPSTPPSSNVDAPINVGTSYQAKAGGLTLGASTASSSIPLDVEGIGFMRGLLLNGVFQYIDGNQGAGKVLTSDAGGSATWQNGSGSGFSYYISTSTATVNRTFTSSAFTGTYPITEAFCASGYKAAAGGGMADASGSQARHAIWYLGQDTEDSRGYICASTDPNENGRLGGCNFVWAMCVSSSGSGSAPSGGMSGVTSIIAGNNVTVNPSYGTGDVTVNTTASLLSGSIGGGCYLSGGTGSQVTNWGNATCTRGISNSTYYIIPSCATAYSAQVISGGFGGGGGNGNGDSALCIKN